MGRRAPSRRRSKAMLATARERMDYLFELAHAEARKGDGQGTGVGADATSPASQGGADDTGPEPGDGGDLELAHRAVRLARLIGMRYNLRLSSEQKLRMCHHCHAFLWPGRTARVRLRDGKLTVHCQLCGQQNRRGYRPNHASSASD